MSILTLLMIEVTTGKETFYLDIPEFLCRRRNKCYNRSDRTDVIGRQQVNNTRDSFMLCPHPLEERIPRNRGMLGGKRFRLSRFTYRRMPGGGDGVDGGKHMVHRDIHAKS